MASEQQPPEFAGKRVLVTGGTKGIGAAVVNRLAGAGAKVLTTARTRPTADETDRFIQADVSTRKGVDDTIQAVQESMGTNQRSTP